MSDILCAYSGDRETTLMSYLYDELAPAERTEFDHHLSTCARCRVELNGFGDIRRRLSLWSPPAFNPAGASFVGRPPSLVRLGAQAPFAEVLPLSTSASEQPPARSFWRDIPAWARAAAAVLVLGAAAGFANLDVHYDSNGGLNIRTGWTKPAPTAAIVASGPADPAPWRAELAALERQLRSEIQTAAPVPLAARNTPANEAEIVRRLKTMIDESERRQQVELALRVAEAVREVNVRRDADLRKIDQSLVNMLDKTGVEVMKNRQMIDYYMQRVSQRQ
jgi:anti-sigma factor RsiW